MTFFFSPYHACTTLDIGMLARRVAGGGWAGAGGWRVGGLSRTEREKPPGPALPTLRHLGLLCNVCRYMCGRNVVEAVSALSLLTFFSLKWLAKSFKDQFGTSQCGWVAGWPGVLCLRRVSAPSWSYPQPARTTTLHPSNPPFLFSLSQCRFGVPLLLF